MGQSSSRESRAAAQVELQQAPVLRQGPGHTKMDTSTPKKMPSNTALPLLLFRGFRTVTASTQTGEFVDRTFLESSLGQIWFQLLCIVPLRTPETSFQLFYCIEEALTDQLCCSGLFIQGFYIANLRDYGIRQLQTFQAQVLQEPAATDDALQSWCRDGGVGHVHLNHLQRAENK